MTDRISSLIKNLKHLPGVYLMHNEDDAIIYIGKAKDLYKRVSQYFLRSQAGKVAKMVSEVSYFETIICNSEKEAFVLEMNLIQTHYPRYNILLKDDSHYPYIALKKKSDPYVTIKRNNKDKNYDYFGPYPNSSKAYQIIDLINKIFPIRKCKNYINKEACLYYHLSNCLAPCQNKIEEEKLLNLREEISSFLKGNNQKILKELEDKMLKASERLEFESANEYKKIIESIKHNNESQNVELMDKKDRDIFGFSERNGYLSLVGLFYRKGVLLGKKEFIIERFDDIEEQVSDLLLQFYEKATLPMEVIINSNVIVEQLSNILDCKVIQVSKGKLFELVVAANENANNCLDQYFISAKVDENKLGLLEELGNLLKIKTPLHIELFDNSHLQGSFPVGAMVAFINGEANKKLYRKFNILSEESRDDLASMKEVIYRHYHRNLNGKLPDLILIDGSINQLKKANESLLELGLSIPLFGLKKNDKHQTSSLVGLDNIEYPIENKKLFFLLTRMQDEVHRYAITFHKSKREKALTYSLLDDIKGLGNKRKEILYKAFKDINDLKNASLFELEQLLPKDIALVLYNKINFNV